MQYASNFSLKKNKIHAIKNDCVYIIMNLNILLNIFLIKNITVK